MNGKIEDGPASIYLKLATALAAVITTVGAVLHGDHSTLTLAAGLSGAGFLVTYALGKYAQATARELAKQTPPTIVVNAARPGDGGAPAGR
jgi:hypothetical protein